MTREVAKIHEKCGNKKKTLLVKGLKILNSCENHNWLENSATNLKIAEKCDNSCEKGNKTRRV